MSVSRLEKCDFPFFFLFSLNKNILFLYIQAEKIFSAFLLKGGETNEKGNCFMEEQNVV